MIWPLIALTAVVLIAWIGTLAWLARGFRRGYLLRDEESPRPPPRRDVEL